GFFFGLFPAWQASRAELQDAMKEGSHASAGAGKQRVRGALVVAEVAISVILLVGSVLMIKSLYRVLHADPGFDAENVMTAGFSLPDAQYGNPDKQRQFVRELAERVAANPGVSAVGVMNPLLGGSQTGYVVQGRPMPKPGESPSTDITIVTPGALEAMGARLLRGRFLLASDTETTKPVCVVDDEMARLAWPGQDPLGKQIAIRPKKGTKNDPDWMTVVGMIGHVKNYGVDQPSREETYVPYAQIPSGGGTLIIRSTGGAQGLAKAVREDIRSLDANLPVSTARTLDDIVGENVAPRRLSVVLLSAFAGLALLLAAVGIYGVMSTIVTQRTNEIGIRIAMGAEPSDVFRLILRSGLGLLAVGMAIGLGGALFVSRFLQTMLFQVAPTDLTAYVSIPALLLVVALAACAVPARRAMRVDPIHALRVE
ncbi:MAG: FtsX-like permease family protein, partial [Bryobacteraceae bacterium]